MRVSRFRVSNYRSIASSEKITLGSFTVLVGPNNEGKSNILRALRIGLDILEDHGRKDDSALSRQIAIIKRFRLSQRYEWKADYPLSRQSAYPNGQTTFEFDFEMNEEEISDFKSEIGSRMGGKLALKIAISSSNSPKIEIILRGPGSKKLNARTSDVCKFITKRIGFEYVPAVRSSDDLKFEIYRGINRQIEKIEQDDQIRAARKKIQDRYDSLLEPYEKKVLDNIKIFVRKATKVSVKPNREDGVFSDVTLMIDDGVMTRLDAKGDGIQSLVVLAMKKAAIEQDHERFHVLALEEPEAHLHPGAVRQLGRIISDMSKKHQVIITTHSPVLVRSAGVGHSIVVKENKARVAKNIEEIRKALGVRLPDNLISADTVLLVEGKTDVSIVGHLLEIYYPDLQGYLKNGKLVIESCDGTGQVQYAVPHWRQCMCKVCVLLDGDGSGRGAGRKIGEDLCDPADIFYISNKKYKKSMLEDLLNWEVFRPLVSSKFKIELSPLSGSSYPVDSFQDRMEQDFKNVGSDYKSMESRVKNFLADKCKEMTLDDHPLNPDFQGVLDRLAARLTANLSSSQE